MTRNAADEWLRPTLLSEAFLAADADRAERLAWQVQAEGPTRWKLATTMGDLEATLPLVQDPGVRIRFGAVLDSVRTALRPSADDT